MESDNATEPYAHHQVSPAADEQRSPCSFCPHARIALGEVSEARPVLDGDGVHRSPAPLGSLVRRPLLAVRHEQRCTSAVRGVLPPRELQQQPLCISGLGDRLVNKYKRPLFQRTGLSPRQQLNGALISTSSAIASSAIKRGLGFSGLGYRLVSN